MGTAISTVLCRNGRVVRNATQETVLMDGYDIESRGTDMSPNTTTSIKCNCAEGGHDHDNIVDDLASHMGTDVTAPFKPILFTMPVGPLMCNMTIIGDPITKEAVLVDPGGHPDDIWAKIQELGVTIKQILITHGHFDHFLSAGDMREKTGAPVYLHSQDNSIWHFLPMQLKLMGISIPYELVENIKSPDRVLADGMKLDILDGVCIHTPGHTAGSCCFYFEKSRILIAGDTLFRNSVGRTDLLGGDENSLRSSILNKLYTLPDSVYVICGHGKNTYIGHEKRNNPFIKANL